MGTNKPEFSQEATTRLQGKLTLTVPEMGKLLGVSRPTAYDLANRADFPTLKVGRRLLIPRAALQKWIEDHTGNAEG